MEKVTKFLNKFGMLIIIGLLSLNLMKSCGTASTQTTIKKEIKALDSSLRTEMKIQSLETSKRMLYDNNAIIRTTVRPDDRMNQYDQEIKKLKGQ